MLRGTQLCCPLLTRAPNPFHHLGPFLVPCRPSRSGTASSSSSLTPRSALRPPDVSLLADAARISLTPKEVEDFSPKITQMIDWFGQLQAVDLESVDPTLRADTEVDVTSQPDLPETFENREAMLACVPCFEEPYIKVPKVLNKE